MWTVLGHGEVGPNRKPRRYLWERSDRLSDMFCISRCGYCVWESSCDDAGKGIRRKIRNRFVGKRRLRSKIRPKVGGRRPVSRLWRVLFSLWRIDRSQRCDQSRAGWITFQMETGANGLDRAVVQWSLWLSVWQFAFTGKRRVIDPPFSGLVTGLPKAPPEIARTCHLSSSRDDTDGPAWTGRTDHRIRTPRWTASGQWSNGTKGSRQNGCVTSGEALAPRADPGIRPAGSFAAWRVVCVDDVVDVSQGMSTALSIRHTC